MSLTPKRRLALEKVAANPGMLGVRELIVGRYNPCPYLCRAGLMSRPDIDVGYHITDKGIQALATPNPQTQEETR